jgi:hypothetical protein
MSWTRGESPGPVGSDPSGDSPSSVPSKAREKVAGDLGAPGSLARLTVLCYTPPAYAGAVLAGYACQGADRGRIAVKT